jgi:hypothetical protein
VIRYWACFIVSVGICGAFVARGQSDPSMRPFTRQSGSVSSLGGNVIPTSPVGTLAPAGFTQATALAVQDDVLYAVSDANALLAAIDVVDPTSPALFTTIPTAANPRALAVSGSFVYVTTNGGTFRAYNVSNPTVMVAGTNTVAVVGQSRGVAVQGRLVMAGNQNNAATKWIDVTDFNNPAIVNSAGKSRWGAFYGKYSLLPNDNDGTFVVWDTVAATAVGTLAGLSGPRQVVPQGEYAYLIENGGNKLDVIYLNNTAAPQLSGSLTITAPSAIAIQGMRAYVGRANAIDVVDVTHPTVPALLGTIPLSSSTVNSLAIQGNYLYAACSATPFIRIYQIGTPYLETLEVGSLKTKGSVIEGPLTADEIRTSGGIAANQSIGSGDNISAGTAFIGSATSTSCAGILPYAFLGDGNTGFARAAANTLLGCAGTVEGFRLTTTTFTIPLALDVTGVINQAFVNSSTSDTTNATATFATVNTVTLPVGTFHCMARSYGTDSVGADGATYRINTSGVTATGQTVGRIMDLASDTFDDADGLNTAGTFTLTAALIGPHWSEFDATYIVTVGGSITLQAAQVAHTTGTLTVYKGSLLRCEKTL